MLAQPDILLLEQPPRQTAHFPFCTDIRAGAHDDIHAVLLSQTAELGHVVIAREIEVTLRLLMDVPENVDADGIHAQRLAHLDAVLPIRARDARIVNLCRLYHERLSIQQEGLVAHGEGTLLRSSCRRLDKYQHAQKDNQEYISSFHVFSL